MKKIKVVVESGGQEGVWNATASDEMGTLCIAYSTRSDAICRQRITKNIIMLLDDESFEIEWVELDYSKDV